MPESRAEQISVVEALVGHNFPRNHRRLLVEQDGWDATYGDAFVRFFGIEEIRTTYLQLLREGPAGLDGFVGFATDGSRELIGYDRRVDPSPVIMIDITATGWSSAKLQGVSFDGFVGRLQAGKGLDFATTYAGPPA